MISGVKLFRPWYGRIVPELITIADLFDMVQTGSFDSGPPIIKSLREHGLLDKNDDSCNCFFHGYVCNSKDKTGKRLKDMMNH